MLINIGKSAAKHIGDENKIKYYAQELKENTYNLTRMNLVMRDILPDNIVTRNGDTLEEDWPYFDESDPSGTYDPLYVDAVVSNPPYSQNWNPVDKEHDARYSRYGVAPKSKADYAFLLHDLFHVKPNGIMTIVLPHGVLFRGGEEGEIRKNLIESNNIDTIIGLPANIFFGTGIPTIIMVLKQTRSNTDVLIIDASKGFEKAGKNNKLRASDIKKIADTVAARKNIEKFSRVVSREEIRQNEYNLNIPRYVDSSEKAESWDIYASMFGGIPAGELNELLIYWEAFPNLKKALFDNADAEYVSFSVPDIKKSILENNDITHFKNLFETAFADLDKYLYDELIGQEQNNINISKEESILSDNIFSRLSGIPLVDVYEAYQMLDNEWNKTAVDLEIIQTEGFEATRQVDPNMVIKKKDNKEIEVQDGWVGHIIPFDMVQKAYFVDELALLDGYEARLSEITSEYEELLEELGEDEYIFVNDDKTAFVAAEVKRAIKAKEFPEETLAILKKYDALSAEEKDLKKKIKTENTDLIMKTKSAIEHFTDEQIREFLKIKWIDPIVSELLGLPDNIVSKLATILENLAKKYDTTFAEIDKEIKETEHWICGMIDDLAGSEFDMKGLEEFKKLLGGV